LFQRHIGSVKSQKYLLKEVAVLNIIFSFSKLV